MPYKILFPICLLILISSCEEVIELDLDSGDQRLIVEANLDATNGRCLVSLSKSGDFYESNNFGMVSDAKVQLSDAQVFQNLGDGQYLLENLIILPQSSVELNILLADGGRIASQVVQAPVAAVLDSLKMDKNGSPGGGNTAGQYTLSAFWKDVPGMENYYRLKIYRNRIFQSETYILSDDRLGDGALIVRPVIRQSYDLGDTLRCELLSVNKAYFDYFTDIASASGQGLSNPSPYNPKGNLQGDALGYFGIWFVSEKTIIVR